MVLDFHSLTTLFTLTTLNLRNNKVLNFDEKIIFDSMKKLTEITLGHYTLNCSELSRLVRELHRGKIKIIPGNITNSSNVLGNPCEEHSDLGETIFFKRINSKNNNFLHLNHTRDGSIEFFLRKIESMLENLTAQIQVPCAISFQNVTMSNKIIKDHAVPACISSLVKENNDHSTKSIENNLIVINILLLTVLFCLLYFFIFLKDKNLIRGNNCNLLRHNYKALLRK
ncbi:hypothetical protein ABEB36_008072 [Hypothenemus hampei]|uniref:Uncharacterized protein n=1 Tax=Hypothenemus hampei TaxID=57062 RepID=A0ABD1EKL7_HYPHA